MKVLTLLAAAGAGAALAYLLDPQQGRQRRALVRDKAYSYGKTFQDRAPKIAKDLQNRAHGVVAETRRLLGHPEPHQGARDVTRPAG
jgi:hypothetical protein